MALMLGSSSIAQACSEPELIAAARDGDDRAFEELYARYHDRISAFILGRVHDRGRAEDIAQEVFMSALRRLRRSQQAIAFKPWIYEIAKNACIDEFRRTQRAHEVSLDADEELTGGPRALRSIAPTPPAAVEGKQRLDDLRGAFGGLSESHHKLLVMREFEGLSYDEIGRRTGMSRQMVESALFRARRKLTEEYEELASGRRCQQVQSVISDGRAQSARALGVRERRQIGRHLAHCQPCRMVAHLAGVDESLLVKPRSIAAKIAGLLPLPVRFWRWPWQRGARARDAVIRTSSHSVIAQVQGAATATDSSGPAVSIGGAALAAAVIALAGAGGAIVSGGLRHGSPSRATAGNAAHRSTVTPGRASVAPRNGQQHQLVGRGASGSPRAVTRLSAISARQHHAPAITSAPSHPRGGGSGSTVNGSASPAGSPAGSTVHAVSSVAGSTSNATQTAARTLSQTTSNAVSAVHKVLNTATATVGATTSSLANTLNGVISTLGAATSSATSTSSSTPTVSTPTVSTPATPTVSTATSTAGSTLSTATGAVKQVASGLLHQG